VFEPQILHFSTFKGMMSLATKLLDKKKKFPVVNLRYQVQIPWNTIVIKIKGG
jgi:hypothetical protein